MILKECMTYHLQVYPQITVLSSLLRHMHIKEAAINVPHNKQRGDTVLCIDQRNYKDFFSVVEQQFNTQPLNTSVNNDQHKIQELSISRPEASHQIHELMKFMIGA